MKRSTEIEAITRRFVIGQSDPETMQRLFSDSPDLVYIGTHGEWAHGPDEILAGYDAEGEVFDPTVTDTNLVVVEAFENGATAWSLGETRITHDDGNVHTLRFSLVFSLDSGVWRIVHVHVSVPVPDAEIWGVELTKTLADLLASIGDESEAGTMAGMGLSVATIVFTDIVGSTVLSEAMGDSAWTTLVTSHFKTLERIGEKHGGSLVKTLGDGAMLAFPTAQAGLTAAIEMQQAVALEATEGLHVRIGVHTGDVVHGEDYIGLTVHKAARVAAAASGDQVLVSVSTAGMVNPVQFDFGDPMKVELKGLSGSHQVVPLDWTE